MSNPEFLQRIFTIWFLPHLSFSATNQIFCTPGSVVLVPQYNFCTNNSTSLIFFRLYVTVDLLRKSDIKYVIFLDIIS